MMIHRWGCYATSAAHAARQTLPTLALPGTTVTTLLRGPGRALGRRALLRHRTRLRTRGRAFDRRTLLRHRTRLRPRGRALCRRALLHGRPLLRHRTLLRALDRRTLLHRRTLRGPFDRRTLLRRGTLRGPFDRRTLLHRRTLRGPFDRRTLVARRQFLAHFAVADLRHVLRHLATRRSGTCTGDTRTGALVAALSLPVGTVVATLTGLHAARTAL
jgi:hypothetical protein